MIDVLHADRLAAVPRDALWHGSLSYLADACAAVGHRDGAAAVYDELVGWRGLVVQVGHLLAANGAVDRYLGKLAALLGHDREAEIHFETAAAHRVGGRHAGVARPQPARLRADDAGARPAPWRGYCCVRR